LWQLGSFADMLKLNGYLRILKRSNEGAPYLATVTAAATSNHTVLVASRDHVTGSYKAVLLDGAAPLDKLEGDVFELSELFDHLTSGDIVRLSPASGAIRVLYRRNSPSNTVLLTERCDHYCLMCSQPPKTPNDDWLLAEAFELIQLIPPSAQELIFSGGEPTLYGLRLVELIRHAKKWLPKTALHVLTNGRAFSDIKFAGSYAAVEHPDIMTGIPIYSDDPSHHDYIVQSRGAFNETVQGVLNLKKAGERVEIRIVIHKETLDRLVKTCEFIARNLVIVDHVALMGLEVTGFARYNLDNLWVDPFDYKDILSEAVTLLNNYRIPTSVYNHQLCTVNTDVFGNCKKSISDWKREYLPECVPCTRRDQCGGLFSSGSLYRHSRHIRPLF
jgi:His-Xaa-Ser system radical SAM maturase HxsC